MCIHQAARATCVPVSLQACTTTQARKTDWILCTSIQPHFVCLYYLACLYHQEDEEGVHRDDDDDVKLERRRGKV